MRKQLGFLVLGAALGALGTYALTDRPVDAVFSVPPERDIGDVAPISVQAAEQHRAERYAEITTIAETLALPTDFAQTEALYVIAGRSSSAELQDLIYDAARIEERLDRGAALQILFLRLTELDPMSAVAIAQSPAFVNEKGFEYAVWENWGRIDLDAALAAAKQMSGADRHRAARALYASLRGIDDTRAQYIETSLGIAPDRNAQMLRIAALAESNPVEALAYVETFSNQQERLQYVGSLAMTLMQRFGFEQASQYATLLQDGSSRQVYESTLNNLQARRDPTAALEQVLAGPVTNRTRGAAIQAYQQLLAQDLDAAEAWYRRTEDRDLKQNFAHFLARSMTTKDPQRAIAWAKSEDPNGASQLLNVVLTQVAERDPETALLEAQAMPHYGMRRSALSSIINKTANGDPARAAQLLTLLGDTGHRQELVATVAQHWGRRDWRAALDWVESSDVPNRRAAINSVGMALLRTDLDSAEAFLARVPSESSTALRLDIATRYAEQRSVDRAAQFISQFENEADYPQLLASVATAAAVNEPDAALDFAQRIGDDRLRDGVLSTVLSQQSLRDPQGALQRLDLMSTEQGRLTATQRIINTWQRQDLDGALTYVTNMQSGPTRDHGLSAIIRSLEPGSERALSLARSISDREVRDQALVSQFYTLAANDPARAQQLLSGLDVAPRYERQILEIIDANR